jgi:uncharacterized protein (DUF924 family)
VGTLQAWAEEPESRLALILVLDQFSRNMFRGTPRMFATDDQVRMVVMVMTLRRLVLMMMVIMIKNVHTRRSTLHYR